MELSLGYFLDKRNKFFLQVFVRGLPINELRCVDSAPLWLNLQYASGTT